MMTVVTVRHGPTEFSREKRIAGTLDVPLDSHRMAVFDEVKPVTEQFRAQVVVSSPLLRALESARLCTSLSEDAIIVRDDCAERNYGKLQGLQPEEIRRQFPTLEYVRVGNFSHSVDPPDGETFPQLRRRAESFHRYLRETHRGKRILVFSHQTFLQQFHGIFIGKDTFGCLSAEIHNLEFNYFYLDSHGDLTEHVVRRLAGDCYGGW
jgi:broad specificity phosphatase PhoE